MYGMKSDDFYKKAMHGIRMNLGMDFGNTKIDKVIFCESKGITILKTKDGKTIKSKVHKEDFDKEKGLLMCICKMNKITHSELKRLIENAINQK